MSLTRLFTLCALAFAVCTSGRADDSVRLSDPEVKYVSEGGYCRDSAGRFARCPDAATKAAEPASPEVFVSVVAGSSVAVGADADAGVQPYLGVDVSFPLSGWDLTPRMNVLLQLSGLAETVPNIEAPGTFKALSARVGVEQPLPAVFFAPFCEAGVATHAGGDPGRTGRGLKHWGCGLTVGGPGARGYLNGWFGQDQRLTGLWRQVGGARGSLKLWESKAKDGVTKGGTVRLQVETVHALREFEDARGNPLRDMVTTVAIAVGK